MKSRKLWSVIIWELVLLAFAVFSEKFGERFDWYLMASGSGIAFYCAINVIQKIKIGDKALIEMRKPDGFLSDDETGGENDE